MNHYVVPVCVAAAVHAALLLGFAKHPHPQAVLREIIREIRINLPVDEDPPELVASEQTESAQQHARDVPQPPRSTEPPALPAIETFTMAPPPIGSITTSDMKQILNHSIDQLGGNGEGSLRFTVLDSAKLDSSPRTRFQPAPTYPYQAKREGIRGEVIVEFMVDERGQVTEPRVVSSSNRIFDETTLRAVAKWQFEPGRRNGRIVRFRMAAPVVFNLGE